MLYILLYILLYIPASIYFYKKLPGRSPSGRNLKNSGSVMGPPPHPRRYLKRGCPELKKAPLLHCSMPICGYAYMLICVYAHARILRCTIPGECSLTYMLRCTTPSERTLTCCSAPYWLVGTNIVAIPLRGSRAYWHAHCLARIMPSWRAAKTAGHQNGHHGLRGR